MNIVLIDPALTVMGGNTLDLAEDFLDFCKDEINEYAISSAVVKKSFEFSRVINEVSSNTAIVLFNAQGEYDLTIRRFIIALLDRTKYFFPIAMNKESRYPGEELKVFQSFDCTDLFHRFDLSAYYLESVAKIFIREVITYLYPTLYRKKRTLFISHRRVDGEEICVELCDKLQLLCQNSFRDVRDVLVGENAQEKIEESLIKSDNLVFLHTPKSSESQWIAKELYLAIEYGIPILWINIDMADTESLIIRPQENPHMNLLSSDFHDEKTLHKIATDIILYSFKLSVQASCRIFDDLNRLTSKVAEFKMTLSPLDPIQKLYSISGKRMHYHYKHRNMTFLIQQFGRTADVEEIAKFTRFYHTHKNEYDSAVMLLPATRENILEEGVFQDTYDNFLYHLEQHYQLERETELTRSVIISGSFTEADVLYENVITQALYVFVKNLIRKKFKIIFGSHPVFQTIIMNIVEKECGIQAKNYLYMYISKFFRNQYNVDKLKEHATVFEIAKGTNEEESLTLMRTEMMRADYVKGLICFGGKIRNKDDEKGVKEEIAIAQRVGIPVYLIGTTGGLTGQIATHLSEGKWEHTNNTLGREKNEELRLSIDYKTLSDMIAENMLGN